MYAVFLFGTASRKTSLVFVLLVPVLPPEMAVLGFFVTVTSAVVLFTFCLPSVLYTVIFTPLWFLITRGISRRLPSEVKR